MLIFCFQDELIQYNIIKEESKQRDVTIFRVCMCAMSFLLGLPMLCGAGMHFLNLVDWSVSGFPLLVVAFIELMIICYGYGEYLCLCVCEVMLHTFPFLLFKGRSTSFISTNTIFVTQFQLFPSMKNPKIVCTTTVCTCHCVS